ncbi:MAG: ISNCY family transposase, partial [Azospirillum sp.]|nr:ISNCY family transposase [Azospirillum sp.]
MNSLEDLLSRLRTVCSGLEDKRRKKDCDYSMTDLAMAAFSVFFMQSPSFLAHQKALADGHGRSNCQTLLGMTAIPCDSQIRQTLDGCAPSAFDR